MNPKKFVHNTAYSVQPPYHPAWTNQDEIRLVKRKVEKLQTLNFD